MPTQPGGYTAPPPGEPTKGGNGCLKAFLIVAGIFVVLGILGTIAVVVLGVGAAKVITDNFGEAPRDAYNLTVDTCAVTDLGAKATGTLTNKSGTRHSFRLDVSFTGSDGVKLGSDTFSTTPSLGNNEKGQWEATTFSTVTGESVKCRVDTVYFNGS